MPVDPGVDDGGAHPPSAWRLGPYVVEGEIGRGGMGVVYRARRADGVGRPVAIKVLGAWIDDAESRRLFADERRILARLDHPHIARLLDAGQSGDGRPYLVMDHVDGRPITAHAHERGLTLEARLRLFEQVCAAVHYAHQNLVVHRDIKPGNILVTQDGVPRLLDFGIARLLERETDGEAPTLTRLRPLTPEYASPEQVRGAHVTTASDVYSLGALLYELLTRLPAHRLRTRAPDEVARVVCEEDPLPPSVALLRFGGGAAHGSTTPEAATATLRAAGATPPRDATAPGVGAPQTPGAARLARRLAGDLDTIVLKALQKDPRRRYGSADELAGDLRRHRAGQPVRARPDTAFYRAGKFVRRHGAAVAVAALALLSLLGGGAAAGWQWRVARRESARAERRFDDVRALAHSALHELYDAIEDLPGATPARALLVERALTYLDSLSRDARGDRSLQRELATAYLRVGDVQGRPNEPNLGDTAGALASYRKALALQEELLAGAAGDAQARRDTAVALTRLATLLDQSQNDVAGALEAARRARDLLLPLSAVAPRDATLQRHVLVTLAKLGDLQVRTRRLDEALATYRRGLELTEALVASPAGRRDDRRTLMVVHYKLYRTLVLGQRRAEAVAAARRMVAMARERVAADPHGATAQRDLAVLLNALGDSLAAEGAQAEALRHYREGLAMRRALSSADSRNALAGTDLVGSFIKIGDVLAAMGDTAGALRSFGAARAIMQAESRRDPANVEARADLGGAQVRMAELHARAGRGAQALHGYQQALPAFEQAAAAGPGNVDARYDLAYALTGLGRAHAALGRARGGARAAHRHEACIALARSLELWRGLGDADSSSRFDAGPASAQAARVERDLRDCPAATR